MYTRSADRSVPGRPEDFAALIDLPWALMRLSGEKAEEMLNSVLTNQVPEEDHLGVYALLPPSTASASKTSPARKPRGA